MLIGVVIIGIFVDILALKWRHLMHYAVYLECLRRFILVMVPNIEDQKRKNANYAADIFITFSAGYTWHRFQILALMITQLFLMTFGQHVVYNKELTSVIFLEVILVLVVTCAGQLCIAWIINFISYL